MTAYVIGVLRELHSQAAWEEYLRSAAKSFPADAKVLAKFGAFSSPEADDVEGVALFAFPTYEAALDWYHSADYTVAAGIRRSAARFDIFIVDGVAIPPASREVAG